MWIIKFPASYPWVFWPLAVAWSIFQALAGYQYGVYIFDSHRQKNYHMRRVRVWSYGVQHGCFLFSLYAFFIWGIGPCRSALIQTRTPDRKSDADGKSVEPGGRRSIKKSD